MKNSLSIVVSICCLALHGCGPDLRSDYDFKCGQQLTDAELVRFEVKSNPQYSFEELKLLGKISSIVFEVNGGEKNYDIQFFENSKDALVIQVFGLPAEEAIDKSACAVFGFKDYIFPNDTVLLFYQDEKSAQEPRIVVGLRKK